jgi:hypothetical protein
MQQRESWANPAHRGAFDKGAQARREGLEGPRALTGTCGAPMAV